MPNKLLIKVFIVATVLTGGLLWANTPLNAQSDTSLLGSQSTDLAEYKVRQALENADSADGYQFSVNQLGDRACHEPA